MDWYFAKDDKIVCGDYQDPRWLKETIHRLLKAAGLVHDKNGQQK